MSEPVPVPGPVPGPLAVAPEPGAKTPLLEVHDLKVHFPITRGVFGRTVGHVKAVDGVSFEVKEGETLGLVGESGCGKTTLGRALLRVYEPSGGQILYRTPGGERVDLAALSPRGLKPFRQQIRMVFQDPHSSLNPRFPVRDIVAEPLKVNRLVRDRDIDEEVGRLLRQAGLRSEMMHRYPHAFSGGERQRIGIARALATSPRLVVADEAVSALDVSVQAQILNLLKRLQRELGLTYVFISHDLSVVEHLSDRVAVMYVGKIVESGPTDELYREPLHPYTEALLSAVPKPDPRLRGKTERIRLPGEVADPANPPPGCPFHPRCAYAQDVCRTDVPPLREIVPGRRSACHFSEVLDLRGVEVDAA